MPASIHHQIDRALRAITWSPETITAYQKKTGPLSVKKTQLPGGDLTRPLPVILGVGTCKSYYDAAELVFVCAKILSGHKLLAARTLAAHSRGGCVGLCMSRNLTQWQARQA